MKIAINQNLTKKISLVFTVFALVILFTLVARAAAPSGGYAPGGTLDPDCAPGATDCIVDQGWLVDTTNNYVYNTTDSIGVGTTTPAVPLHLTSGDFLIGNTLAHSSGTELKFIFDKSKGAFRGGSVTNMAWDDANVGVYSFAYGLSPWATATGSVAFGSNSSSTGQASFAT
ncbi:MAG: hypothetical protein OEX08_03295, partial [Candidatus Nomurabacteria bacterium]|nr:hypothetical protein [Candidatus Nomurabacteria bacterium]